MSYYVQIKAIRIPFKETGLEGSPYDFEDRETWGYQDVGKFSASPTESPFVDYILERDSDSDCGEYGKVRDLYPNEYLAWEPIFKREMPNCNFSKARLVEFCWYNCSEAPDYYSDDPEADPFFKEVLPE